MVYGVDRGLAFDGSFAGKPWFEDRPEPAAEAYKNKRAGNHGVEEKNQNNKN